MGVNPHPLDEIVKIFSKAELWDKANTDKHCTNLYKVLHELVEMVLESEEIQTILEKAEKWDKATFGCSENEYICNLQSELDRVEKKREQAEKFLNEEMKKNSIMMEVLKEIADGEKLFFKDSLIEMAQKALKKIEEV